MTESDVHLSVVVPVFNESEGVVRAAEAIKEVLDQTEWSYEIILVDDGSTDGTRAVCERRQGVKVISHPYNRGAGAARSTGVRVARGRHIIMIDADGSYPTSVIPSMLDDLAEYDMVIGARDRETGTLRWLRSAAKNFIRALASYLTQTRIPDLNSGLRAMKREQVLEFLPILPTTHSWVSTITMAFLSNGYNVRWIPIAYRKRVGRSSFHPIADTYNYLSLVVRAIMYFNPLRVFLPVSLTVLLVGAAKMIYDIIAYRFHFAPSTVILMIGGLQLGAIGLLADLIVRRSKL